MRAECGHQHVEVRLVGTEIGWRWEDDIAGNVHVVERRELHIRVRADIGEATDLELPRGVDRRRFLRAAQVVDDDAQVGHRNAQRLHLVLRVLRPTADDRAVFQE